MSELLIAFGVLIALAGIAAVLRPRGLLNLARRITVRTWLRWIAFIVRTLLGAILILVAPSTAFPLVLEVVGVLLIVSGIVVLMIGNEAVQRLLNFGLSLGPPAVAAGGFVGILFGAFLIYVGI